MRLLHISLNTTHSECKPSSSISSFTHSLQVFLPLPAHLTPATTTLLVAGWSWDYWLIMQDGGWSCDWWLIMWLVVDHVIAGWLYDWWLIMWSELVSDIHVTPVRSKLHPEYDICCTIKESLEQFYLESFNVTNLVRLISEYPVIVIFLAL